MGRKYAESKKRREKRRKLAKQYYSVCFRNMITLYDHMWVGYEQTKSKNIIIQILSRIIVNEDMDQIMSVSAPIFVNTWHFSARGRMISVEILALTKVKTIREHVEDYIFEQRCMIRSSLPKDLVRMLYTFL